MPRLFTYSRLLGLASGKVAITWAFGSVTNLLCLSSLAVNSFGLFAVLHATRVTLTSASKAFLKQLLNYLFITKAIFTPYLYSKYGARCFLNVASPCCQLCFICRSDCPASIANRSLLVPANLSIKSARSKKVILFLDNLL